MNNKESGWGYVGLSVLKGIKLIEKIRKMRVCRVIDMKRCCPRGVVSGLLSPQVHHVEPGHPICFTGEETQVQRH